MSDLAAAPAAAPVVNSSAADTSSTSAEQKAPVETKAPETEPTEEFEIDGKKVQLTRTQQRTYIQKASAVDKRMQTTAEKEKKLDTLISDFEKDPEGTLAKLGKNPEKILADLLERKAKQALLTPEQREKAKLEEERDALKADKEKREKDQKEKADADLDQHNQSALEEQLVDASDRYGLDRTPETLEGLADVALDLLDLLGGAVTADQVVQEYMRRDEEHLEARDRKLIPKLKGPRLLAYLKSNVSALLKLPPAELMEALGPAGVKLIQDATLTKVPGPGQMRPKPTTVAPPARNGSTGRYMTEGQFDSKKR